MIDVIYLNGGEGVRVGLGYPKQFARLKGKPIFIYGLEVLRQIKEINRIFIPTHPDENLKTLNYLKEYSIDGNWLICTGGKSRQESVYKTLNLIETDYVLIAESVRPFITKNLIEKLLRLEADMNIPRNNTISTLIDDTGETFNRRIEGEVQTPQKFKTSLLKQAYEKAKDNLMIYTDDSALVTKIMGANSFESNFYSCNVFVGPEENIKITSKLDLYLAEAIIKYREGEINE